MTIDIKLTGKCNMNCEYCWDASKNVTSSSLSEVIITLEKLRKAKVNILSITGGEPLLYPHFVDVLKVANELGFRIYLSTNGLLLNKFINEIKDYIHLIGIPLDSVSPDNNIAMGRNADMHKITSENIKIIKESNDKILVKVGTVLSSKNYQSINDIGNFLFDMGNLIPDYWRIYQFAPLGSGKNHADKYLLADDVCLKIINNLYSKYGKEKVSYLCSNHVSNSYLLLNPNMDLVLLKDKYYYLGNVITMPQADIDNVIWKNSKVATNSKRNRAFLEHI